MISRQAKMQQFATACRKALADFSAPTLQVHALYLHGTWGTEYERADSDIDLVVLANKPLNLEQRFQFEQLLRQQLHLINEIDVINLCSADTVFAAHVVTEARCIVRLDQGEIERFEMLALGKYARLNEARAGIVADIQRRGTVYMFGLSA